MSTSTSIPNQFLVAVGTPVDPPYLADVPALIQSWPDLSVTRRRDVASAVSRAIRICALPDIDRDTDDRAPSPLTMCCSDLNTRLFRRTPAAYGLTPESFSNVLSQLRFVLRRLGGHEPPYAGAGTLQPSWRTLHDSLPTLHRRTALSGIMRFGSDRSIEPGSVTADTLADYEASLLDRTLCRDAPVRARGAASNWNWASEHVPGWPKTQLKRPRMRAQYVLPLTAYPAELQADVERYLAGLACSGMEDIFPDDADAKLSGRSKRRKALRPRTIETRCFQLRQALVAMVLMGRDAASITSLCQLVNPPEQARAIMAFYLERSGKRTTSQTGGIAEVLRQLARYHCRLGDDAVKRIATWAHRAAPEQQTVMSEKNTLRLRALLEPHARAKLLHLPARLMSQAANPELRPRAAALLALYATALELLLFFPMRRSNLARLRLDQHLQRLGAKGKCVSHISLQVDETKNDQAMLWPVPGHGAALLEAYLHRYRPQLAAPGNPYLFPNTKMGGRSPHDLAVGLTDLVQREIGCAFNMHLARHFAVALYLQRNPGQYEVARRILGHKRVKTTTDFYAGLGLDAAARQLDVNLDVERSETKLIAAAAFRRGRRKPVKTPRAGLGR